MSNDWLRNFAIGGCIAALLLLPRISSAQDDQSKQQIEAQPQTTQQSTTPNPTPSEDVDRPKSVDTNWKKLDCAEPKNHDEADLCEQRRMSKAAEKAIILNVVQLILSVVGAGLVLWSLHYSRVSAKAAIAAAATAKEAVDESRQIGRAQVRAYLSCEKALYTLHENFFTCNVFVRNHGQSPAIWTEIKARLVTKTAPSKYVRSEAIVIPGPAIAAGETGKIFIVILHGSMGEGAHAALWENGWMFDVRGRIAWRDVFGETSSQDFLLNQDRNDAGTPRYMNERKGELTSYNHAREQPSDEKS